MGSSFSRLEMVDSYVSRRFPLFHLKIGRSLAQLTTDVGAIQFHLIPVREWYKKQEMLEDARAYGLTVTESQFDDWVEKGLVGSPHRERLGRGRGSPA